MDSNREKTVSKVDSIRPYIKPLYKKPRKPRKKGKAGGLRPHPVTIKNGAAKGKTHATDRRKSGIKKNAAARRDCVRE